MKASVNEWCGPGRSKPETKTPSKEVAADQLFLTTAMPDTGQVLSVLVSFRT